MNPWLPLQGLRDLSELLVGVQSQIDKDPLAAAKLAGPAAAPAKPFVTDVVPELIRNFTTFFEKFYSVHPSLSI
ncbi:MAG: hypothetical protein O3C40_10075 [Planctomycetota bacterium]|nr:hypothetical protein [Planctomycetota bacterium]